MRKENVFLVSGRQSDAAGDPCGAVINCVLCCHDEESLKRFVPEKLPGFVILSTVNLVTLERTAKKVKESLSGVDTNWPVFVETGLQQ